ncbi:MAG: tol-pal system protein YbgF [Halioglobus sp.]
MRGVRIALQASGLALLVGPLCLTVQAQEYVDVEAERAAQRNAGSVDSQTVQPTGTTSYGLNSAPAGPAVVSAPAAAVSGDTGQNQSVGNMLVQLQQLQQEVRMLNGKVEEQSHELRRLKDQSLERYVDLDRRVSTLTTGGSLPPIGASGSIYSSTAGSSTGSYGTSAAAGGGSTAPAASGYSGGGSTYTAPAATTTPTVSAGAANSGAEQPGEGDAYRAAYALVRGQQFDDAVSAFQQFLVQYPSGRYAPNAHYWLGELFLVLDPPDLEQARQSFSLLLTGYPGNAKVPDALYKLGRVHFMKGNREKSREYLDRVISEYGSTNSSAVKLAQDFINENF